MRDRRIHRCERCGLNWSDREHSCAGVVMTPNRIARALLLEHQEAVNRLITETREDAPPFAGLVTSHGYNTWRLLVDLRMSNLEKTDGA
jgi:hypothetical protein